MTDEKTKVWNEAVEWARADELASRFEESDKREVLLALFRKASNIADTLTDPAKKAEMEAYSEGFRHALNIMDYRGKGLDGYRGIINPSIKIALTEKEVQLLSVE